MTKIEFLEQWHQQTNSFFGLISCAGDFKRMVELIDKYKPILDELHIQRYKDFADEQGMVGEQREALFNMLGIEE